MVVLKGCFNQKKEKGCERGGRALLLGGLDQVGDEADEGVGLLGEASAVEEGHSVLDDHGGSGGHRVLGETRSLGADGETISDDRLLDRELLQTLRTVELAESRDLATSEGKGLDEVRETKVVDGEHS